MEDEQYSYYASCNFYYNKDMDGISSPEAVNVYLLDPRRGSITTMLEYDHEDNRYVIAPDFEQLDTFQIKTITEAIKQYQYRIPYLK